MSWAIARPGKILYKFWPSILVLTAAGVVTVSLYKTERLLWLAYAILAGWGTAVGAIGLMVLLFVAQALFVDRSRDIEVVEFFFMYLVAPVGGLLGLTTTSTYFLVDELYFGKARGVLLIGGWPILLMCIPNFVWAAFSRGGSGIVAAGDVGLYVAYLLFGLLPVSWLVGMWRWIPQKRASQTRLLKSG